MLRSILLILLLGLAGTGQGQFDDDQGFNGELDLKPTDVIHWESVGAELDGVNVTVGLRLTTEQNFTLYMDKVKFKGPEGFAIENLDGPTTKQIVDPITGEKVDVYYGGDFIIKFNGLEPYQKDTFPLAITFLGCTERICLFPYTEVLDIKTYVGSQGQTSQAPPPSPPPTLVPKEKPAAIDATEPSGDLEQSFAQKVQDGELPLGVLLLVLFLGGLATNLTPCVFPMIPITIRILGNQKQSPWTSSTAYASGILITYSAIGVVAALTGGLFGSFMASTAVNVAFAAIFIVLALTMLGFGNFSKLQNIGSRMGAGGRSIGHTFLMGAGAGLVAAPCTGPIMGALLAYAAKSQDPTQTIFLFSVYSFGFALPYIFLGGAAGRIGRLKVSPQVQVGVKLAFAAIMFGLALYFLRIPAHEILQSLQGQWFHLTMGFGLVGLVFCGFVLMKHSHAKAMAIAPTLVLGIGLFAGAKWLTGGDLITQIKWHKTLESGFAEAKKQGKPIIIDGWAEWCEACKKMDKTQYQK